MKTDTDEEPIELITLEMSVYGSVPSNEPEEVIRRSKRTALFESKDFQKAILSACHQVV